LDEIVIRRGSTAQACQEFLRRFPRHNAGVVVFGDASGFHQQTTGLSDYEMVREHFQVYSSMRVSYRIPKANPGARDLGNLVNSQLRSAAGAVRMWVDPKCRELIKDFEQVSYKADTNQIDKDRDRLRTHLTDALGYLLWQERRPVAPVGEQRGRLL